MNELLTAILTALGDMDPFLRTGIAGLGILLETSILVGLVVPGDSIVLVASTGVGNAVEYWALVVVVIVGALCGESLGFGLGRLFGPRLRASRLGRRIGEAHWVRAETYLARRGGLAIFLSRFLPVLHSLVPVTVGMSPMTYRRFLSWTAPACIVWALAYVSVGAAAAGGFRELSTRLHMAGYLFVAAIVLFGLLILLVKKLVQRAEARHMRHDDAQD